MISKKDLCIVRNLASRVAEIAALPIQEEKRALWRKLNALKPSRPMVMIAQICWNELNVDGEIEPQCEDPECRKYEQGLRRTLYQWEHFPVDMVVEPFMQIPKAIRNSGRHGFGVGVKQKTASTDPTSNVLSKKYENQFQTESDLEKLRLPKVSHDEKETERRLTVAHELFDGLLDVRPWSVTPNLSLWDPIATWMGVENALYCIIDKPDFMHRLLGRLTDCYLSMLDQLEEQGLLSQEQCLVHCTGAYSDELPPADYDPQRPRTKDMWMYTMAQMLSTVSPDMFKEFEVDYVSRICERFGLVYYGCCEPLDGNMAEVRMIPNVRKISMSPWANEERGAEEIGSDFVYSRKPNPAFVAMDSFHPDQVREDLSTTRKICDRHGCPLEFILKDISTVRNEPQRLDEWARIAMEVAED